MWCIHGGSRRSLPHHVHLCLVSYIWGFFFTPHSKRYDLFEGADTRDNADTADAGAFNIIINIIKADTADAGAFNIIINIIIADTADAPI